MANGVPINTRQKARKQKEAFAGARWGFMMMLFLHFYTRSPRRFLVPAVRTVRTPTSRFYCREPERLHIATTFTHKPSFTAFFLGTTFSLLGQLLVFRILGPILPLTITTSTHPFLFFIHLFQISHRQIVHYHYFWGALTMCPFYRHEQSLVTCIFAINGSRIHRDRMYGWPRYLLWFIWV